MKTINMRGVYIIVGACALALSSVASGQYKISNNPQFKQGNKEMVVQKAPTPYPKEATLFFDKAPYIHPKVIKELSIWISDQEEAIVSVNLTESVHTNRFFGDIKIKPGHGDNSLIEVEEMYFVDEYQGLVSFSYELVGVLESNIYVLRTVDWGGGSGHFVRLILVRYECGFGLGAGSHGVYAIEVEKENLLSLDRPRVLITKMAEIAIGDRWIGKIEVAGNTIIKSENIGSRNDDYTDIIYDSQSFTIQVPPESTCIY